MNKHPFWSFVSTNITAIITIAVGAALVLEPLGLISASKIPIITLLLLTLLATSELAERTKRLNHVEVLLDQIANSSTSVVHLPKSEDWYEYLAKALLHARESVEDVVLSPRTVTPDSIAKQHYYRARTNAINNPNITYCHATAILDQTRLDYVVSVIPKALKVRYWVSIIDSKEFLLFPSINFVLIDKQEVVFGAYQSPFVNGGQDAMIATKDPQIVKMFSDYFDLIWPRCTPLISRTGVNRKLLKEISRKNDLDMVTHYDPISVLLALLKLNDIARADTIRPDFLEAAFAPRDGIKQLKKYLL